MDMGMSVADALIALAWQLLVVTTLVVSVWAVLKLSDPGREMQTVLTDRFYLGVPWGSLVVIGGVLFVYLFVQRGLWYPDEPLSVAFSAWSYFYPLGMLFSSFSHADGGHIIGNLTTAIVFAPIAEYIWGHYTAGERWSNDPRIRAFVLFPLGVFAVGIIMSLFKWGPVIGFSGVVFALIGFVLVRYPLLTVVALAARSAVRTLSDALVEPVSVVEVTASVSPPWWYGIAVQGHALGLFVGVLLGAALLRHRRVTLDPLRLWLGTVLTTLSLSLWAIWWVRGAATYVLYQALGIVLVLVLSLLVTAVLTADERPFVGGVTRRQAATAALVIPLLIMCLAAVPLNLVAVNDQPREAAVESGDYTVFYDEEVENEMFSVVEIEALGESTDVTTSGVIVTSAERNVWGQQISVSELETHGEATVRVGGLTWSETIDAERAGWEVGDEQVYTIWFENDGERTHAYDSEPASADVVIDGRMITLDSEHGFFFIEIESEGGGERTEIPQEGTSVELDGLEIENDDGVLVVSDGETSVPIAEEETYVPRQDDL